MTNKVLWQGNKIIGHIGLSLTTQNNPQRTQAHGEKFSVFHIRETGIFEDPNEYASYDEALAAFNRYKNFGFEHHHVGAKWHWGAWYVEDGVAAITPLQEHLDEATYAVIENLVEDYIAKKEAEGVVWEGEVDSPSERVPQDVWDKWQRGMVVERWFKGDMTDLIRAPLDVLDLEIEQEEHEDLYPDDALAAEAISISSTMLSWLKWVEEKADVVGPKLEGMWSSVLNSINMVMRTHGAPTSTLMMPVSYARPRRWPRVADTREEVEAWIDALLEDEEEETEDGVEAVEG